MDAASHYEVVLLGDHLTKAQERLHVFFGPPVEPGKDDIPRHVQKQINASGGIRQGQTLYYRSLDDGSVFAMLWPWSDGIHTTLKVIKA